MYPVPGHLACGLVVRAISRLNLIVILIATFLPDIVDKLLSDILHIAPYGRTYMHCIPILVLISVLLAGIFRDIKIGCAWAAGHFAHLIADISFIPWWFPLRQYDWPGKVNVVQATLELRHLASSHPQQTPLVAKVFIPEILLMEMGLLLLAVSFCLQRPKRTAYRAVIAAAFIALMTWRLCLYG